MVDKQEQKMLEFVANCDDPDKLRGIASNAKRLGAVRLHDEAKRRLYMVLPSEQPGTLEYAVWQSIFALEDTLKEERGKTVLLARTRQKIKSHGEHKCVADLVLGKQSDGFDMLRDRQMLDLSFEAVGLNFAGQFSEDVLSAAKARLDSVGYVSE